MKDYKGQFVPKTVEQIKETIRSIWGDKYNLDNMVYKDYRTPVNIICPKHGEVFVRLDRLRERGCPKCSREQCGPKISKNAKGKRVKPLSYWIKKCKEVHGEKYDYSLFKDGVTTKDNVNIICKHHGVFSCRLGSHIYLKNGCPRCNEMTTEKFIEKAKRVHGDKYDYSKVEYTNSYTKVKIICHEHGDFLQKPNNHLQGNDCPRCKEMTTEKFIEKSKKIHENKYIYSKVNYTNTNTKVTIICPEHGEFLQVPYSHLQGNGCPRCNESKGEKQVEKLLTEQNIKYEKQKRFKDCRNKLPLPFDFYLPELNILIEYDGEQHFKPFRKIKNKEKAILILKQTQLRDKIKTDYCLKNNIPLIRIKYTDSIEEKLELIFNKATLSCF